jgi:cytochrome c5
MESLFRLRACFVVLAAIGPSISHAVDPNERDGRQVVQAVCFRCHESPQSPAPKVGDRAAWVPRLSKGIDALVLSAVRGHGGMPPRGGAADLTDNEIRSAILFMYNPAGPPAAIPSASKPAPPGQSLIVNGMRIHLGLTSAARMRQYPSGSPEAKLHGGVPAGDGYEHVNVSIFDAMTDEPVRNATVSIEVEQVGMETKTTSLEAYTLGGIASYGAYVKLLPKATYVFHVKAIRPGSGGAVEAKFPQPPG